MTVRRAAVLAASAAFAVAAVWAASRPEEFWFDGPAESLAKAEARFYAELLASEGMAALWTFDGRDGGGWFAGSVRARVDDFAGDESGLPSSVCSGTELVPGRHGGARRFSGGGGCAESAHREREDEGVARAQFEYEAEQRHQHPDKPDVL